VAYAYAAITSDATVNSHLIGFVNDQAEEQALC